MAFQENLKLQTDAYERSVYAPVIGVALSSNTLTPNFIHTYKDKESAASAARINRTIAAAVILLLTLFVGGYYWQSHLITLKRTQKDQLQRQSEHFVPAVDEKLVLEMLSRIRQNQQRLSVIGSKHSGLALISAVCRHTPKIFVC